MPGVFNSDPSVHEMIGAVLDARLAVTGHWSLHGWTDHRLHAYAASGVDSDHESVLKEDALAKLRAGMWVQLREGSAWHNVAELSRVITEDGVDSRHILLVTDDMHPETLANVGHMNHVVRTAIASGLDPMVAIQAATVNAAEYMGMRADLGSIAPGRCADVLFVEHLAEMRPHLVLCDGARVPSSLPSYPYPDKALASVRIPDGFSAEDLRLAAEGTQAEVRVIGIVRGELATEHRLLDVPATDGQVQASVEMDLAKAASIERHGGPGTIGLGFVQGLGLKGGAIASTVAHDNHNLLVIGTNDDDMVAAVRRLEAVGGGMVAVRGGEVLGEVVLPIAGLISDRPVEELATQVDSLDRAYKALGCELEYPFMMVSILSLGVIPALRLTNRGLVDGRDFKLLQPLVR
jgi:adenine deaminase